MRFDLKFLLRLVTIASVLIWALIQANLIAILCAMVLVSLIGAFTAKESVVTSSVHYSLGAGVSLLIGAWFFLIYEAAIYTNRTSVFTGDFEGTLLFPIFFGVVVVIPVSWILGFTTGLAVLWCKEIVPAIKRELQPDATRSK